MCMVEKGRYWSYEEMSLEGLRGLRGFCSLHRMEYDRALVVTQAGWQNGGTVIPPCVFQGRNTKNALNKGSPSVFPHGLRAHAGACAHAHTPKQLKPNWSV